MVVTSNRLFFVNASEDEVNALAAGTMAGFARPWSNRSLAKVSSGEVLVVAEEPAAPDAPVRPLAMVAGEEDYRRLFGRFSSLRTDLSPISSWCHIFTPDAFGAVDGATRGASLSGYEASWCGLVVAEAALLSARSVDKLKIAACLATPSFAIARTAALWPRINLSEVLERHGRANEAIRGASIAPSAISRRLQAIASALIEAEAGDVSRPLGPAHTIRQLRDAREAGMRFQESRVIADSLLMSPVELQSLIGIEAASPEERVGIFDRLISALTNDNPSEERRETLSFLAGYLATVAAGGTSSIGLADQVSRQWPEILAWAYVIGGIGERVTWTSGFQGLGRLITRDLMRPFHLDEAPTCDFGYEEAMVLVDRQLNDPLVHLSVKQQRVATVALYPGVNIAIPLQEQPEPVVVTPRQAAGRSARELEQLAFAVWPLIEERLQREGLLQEARRAGPGKRRGGVQGKLPLEK